MPRCLQIWKGPNDKNCNDIKRLCEFRSFEFWILNLFRISIFGFRTHTGVWQGLVLHMATIVAIRHNPVIKAFYAHLKSKDKESKVAIVACMRKFISILNLLAKTDQLGVNKMSVWTDTFQTLADTSLTHRRLGYPSLGCAPQSLTPFHRADAVYTTLIQIKKIRPQQSLNTAAIPKKIQHPCRFGKELQNDFEIWCWPN